MEKLRTDSKSGPGWDPVCGMLIKAKTAHASRRSDFDGNPFRFVEVEAIFAGHLKEPQSR